MSSVNFKLFHVGGGDCEAGAAQTLYHLGKSKGNKVELYVFEANLNTKEFRKDANNENVMVKWMKDNKNIDAFIIPYCITDHVGKDNFYINKFAKSSSLLKMSPKAVNELRRRRRGKISWKSVCEVREVREVEVTTFDKLFQDGIIPQADLLSMDAQGSEFSIMKGGSSFMQGDLLAIATEVEFKELYDNQPLFADQDTLLRENEFDFFCFIGFEEWYSHHIIGKGEQYVAEAFYMRNHKYFVKKYKDDLDKMFTCIAKLAVVSLGFKFLSNAYEIIYYMKNNFEDSWDSFILNSDSENVNTLNSFYDDINAKAERGEIL